MHPHFYKMLSLIKQKLSSSIYLSTLYSLLLISKRDTIITLPPATTANI